MAWVYFAGMAIQAVSQIQQSRAQASSMEAQADAAEVQAQNENTLLEHNAKIKEREGAAEVERAREAARQFGREGEALQATQQVQLAKGGVLTAGGTPALLFEETAKELEMDRMSILREGFLNESLALSQAQGLRLSGEAALSRGQFTSANLKSGAKSVKSGGYLSAGGTLLSGIGGASAMKGSALTKTGSAGGSPYIRSLSPAQKTSAATQLRY